jgi:autotransporter translocation and assembly factor TamB
MPTRSIRWLTWAVLAILALAGFVFALSLIVRAYAPLLTREGLQDALTHALDRPVRVGRVRLVPWIGRITLQNVTIGPGPEGGPDPALRVGELELQVGISSLWTRRLVVSGALSDVVFDLVANASAQPLPPLDVPDSFRLGPIEVELRAVRLARGSGTYRNPAEGYTLALRDLEGAATPLRHGVDASLRLAALNLQGAGGQLLLTEVRGAGWLGQELLTIRALSARWSGRPLALTGEVRQPFETPLLAVTVSGEVDLAAAANLAKASWPLAGVAHVEGELRGPPAALEATGRVGVPRLVSGPVDAQNVALRVRWRAGVLEASEVSAQVFGGSLKGAAEITPAHLERTRLQATLTGAALARVQPLLHQPLGTADVDVEAQLEGDPRRWDRLQGSIRLAARHATPPGEWAKIGPGTLRLAGRVQQGAADLNEGIGDWPGLHVEASGPLAAAGPRGVHVRLEAELGTLAPLLHASSVAGRLQAAGDLTGPWDALEASARVESPSLRIDAVRVENVAGGFRLRGQTIQVDALAARLDQSRATASGTIAWTGPLAELDRHYRDRVQVRAELRGSTIHWEDLARWLPPAGQGAGPFSIQARVEGTLAAWRGSGTLDAPAVAPARGPSVQRLQARFAVDSRQLDISSLQAEVLGASVRGAGTWGWDRTGRGRLEVAGLDVTRLPDLPAGLGLRGTGAAQLEASFGSGTWDAGVTARLQDVTLRDFRLGSGTLQGRLRANQIQASAAFPDARLGATAQGPLGGAAPLTVTAEARDWQIGPLLRARGEAPAVPIEGALTARAVFQVPVSNPGGATGTVTLDPVRLTVAEEPWANHDPLVLRWDGSALLLQHVDLVSRLGRFTATGRAEPHGRLDLEANGAVPLGILPLFRPEIREAGGLITLTARVTGSANAPRLNGEGAVRNGVLQLRDRPETLRDIEARVVMAPEGIRLIDAVATLGRGRLQAAGTLTLEGFQLGAYRFTLRGQDVSLSAMEGMQTAWNANLELVGRGARALLRGEAHLVRGAISGKFSLVSLLLSKPAEKPEPKAAIPLRILLFLDNNLRVSMNVARLAVGGRLSLEGTTADPVLLGSVQGEEGGRIVFRGQRWTVLSAVIRFIDPRGIEPLMDVAARATIKNYDVTLRLSGRPDELAAHLSSSPPLAQDKLLMLVALGTTGDTAGQAGGALAGEVGRMVAEELFGSAVGASWAPDVVSVEKNAGSQQLLQVGKQVTEDIRVLYSQSISGPTTRMIKVEYQVIGPLLLSAEQDFQGGFGGEVVVRLRFR